MSDECLMKQEFGFPFYIVYQAVMRKFTLAGKSLLLNIIEAVFMTFYPTPHQNLHQAALERNIYCLHWLH